MRGCKKKSDTLNNKIYKCDTNSNILKTKKIDGMTRTTNSIGGLVLSDSKIINGLLYVSAQIPPNTQIDDYILNLNSPTPVVGYLIFDLNLNYIGYEGVKSYGNVGYSLLAKNINNEVFYMINATSNLYMNNTKYNPGIYILKK